MIGDRLTDMALARNLGCGGILIGATGLGDEELAADADVEEAIALRTDAWDDIHAFLRRRNRRTEHRRTTKEDRHRRRARPRRPRRRARRHRAQVLRPQCSTRSPATGDRPRRHGAPATSRSTSTTPVEDTALALGEAFATALGDKRGLARYGFALPMDDCEAHVSVDFGGRPWLVWEADFHRERVGATSPTELFHHFFKSFSDAARCNLHVRATGTNEHHKIEAIFKAFARAVRMAVRVDVADEGLPTTKGVV